MLHYTRTPGTSIAHLTAGESVILFEDHYYGLKGAASTVWDALDRPQSANQLIERFETELGTPLTPQQLDFVSQAIASLHAAGLLLAA